MDRRTYLSALTAATAVGIAGCASSDAPDTGTDTATGTPAPAGEGTPTAGDTPTATATPDGETPASTATATDGATATATPTPTPRPAVAAEVTVAPDGKLRFDPEQVTIATGEAVRWTWNGSGHNVKPDGIPSASDWTGTAGPDSKTYPEGHVYTHTFTVAGTFDYKCVPHASVGMRGTVVVE